MPNKELGIADPVYDALRIRSGQSIAPDLGGGTTGGSGLENKIYVWHADGSTIDTFEATGAGLNLANVAAVSGDTIWLPSIAITLSGTLTIAAGVTVTGISWSSVLTGTIVNNGTLRDCEITGNVTNNAGGRLERIRLSVATGTGITQAASATIERCSIQVGVAATYGIDISDGYIFHSTVGTDGGTVSTGVYIHGANVEVYDSRFAGYVGGKVEQAYIVASCSFYGSQSSPITGSHGLIHATSGTARITNSTFICASSNSFGASITNTGLTLTDCAWNSIDGLSNITYGTGDRSPLNHTHTAPNNVIQYVSGDISNPPTEAELAALIGSPAAVGVGAAYLVRDTSTSRYYMAISDGAQFQFLPFISPASGTATGALAGAGGAWPGLSDPHAIYYNGFTYYGYIGNDGSVKIHAYNNGTQVNGAATTLHTSLGEDDHNAPSILIRNSDKRILAFYSAHGGSTVYERISTNAEDVSAFDAEVSLTTLGGSEFSYPMPIQLTGEASEPIYLLWRNPYDANTQAWWISKSTDGGATWPARTDLYKAANRSGYMKGVANGTTRIDFIVSDGHPAYDSDVSIYHFYYSGGNYYQSDGTLIGGAGALPLAPANLTKVHDGVAGDNALLWDIAIDGSGYPILVYATFPTTSDHRYQYAAWNGSAWAEHEITAAGGGLYPAQPYYSGGIVLDHTDPQIVYLSKVVSGQWEIYKYTTANGGVSFSNAAITTSSAQKNIRPDAIRNHTSNLKILWLYGTYTTYIDYSLTLYGSDQ